MLIFPPSVVIEFIVFISFCERNLKRGEKEGRHFLLTYYLIDLCSELKVLFQPQQSYWLFINKNKDSNLMVLYYLPADGVLLCNCTVIFISILLICFSLLLWFNFLYPSVRFFLKLGETVQTLGRLTEESFPGSVSTGTFTFNLEKCQGELNMSGL